MPWTVRKTAEVKPAARPFYRQALGALEHARQHASGIEEIDAAQVVLSLDYAAEMMLKAVLLQRGESIMQKPGYSVGLQSALKRVGVYQNGTSVEILRERRDSLQHLAAVVDAATTADLYEGVVLFVEEVLDKEFGLPLPAGLKIWTTSSSPVSGAEVVQPRAGLQRDVHAAGDVVVWAETSAGTNELAVIASVGGAEPRRLSDDNAFEYMPRTDGQLVVAYRQGGGVVLYDLSANERTVVAESGGPTDIRTGFIAAQGLDVGSGLGEGIWLYSISTASWDRLSEAGDSARLTSDYVFWQEFDGESMTIRRRALAGGPTEVLLREGGHPSPSGADLAWSDWPGQEPLIHVAEGGLELVTLRGIFPHLQNRRVAFLEPRGSDHDLVVYDIGNGARVVDLKGVGFPIGGGPVIAGDWVYFESRSGRATHAIHRVALP